MRISTLSNQSATLCYVCKDPARRAAQSLPDIADSPRWVRPMTWEFRSEPNGLPVDSLLPDGSGCRDLSGPGALAGRVRQGVQTRRPLDSDAIARGLPSEAVLSTSIEATWGFVADRATADFSDALARPTLSQYRCGSLGLTPRWRSRSAMGVRPWCRHWRPARRNRGA
jgi:hypothetical protein